MKNSSRGIKEIFISNYNGAAVTENSEKVITLKYLFEYFKQCWIIFTFKEVVIS